MEDIVHVVQVAQEVIDLDKKQWVIVMHTIGMYRTWCDAMLRAYDEAEQIALDYGERKRIWNGDPPQGCTIGDGDVQVVKWLVQ